MTGACMRESEREYMQKTEKTLGIHTTKKKSLWKNKKKGVERMEREHGTRCEGKGGKGFFFFTDHG